jgi:hypothetical protein
MIREIVQTIEAAVAILRDFMLPTGSAILAVLVIGFCMLQLGVHEPKHWGRQ